MKRILFAKHSNIIKRIICIMLVAAMSMSTLSTGVVAAYAGEPVTLGDTQEEFTPVLRFAVTSDVHVRPKNKGVLNGYEQLAAFFSTAYEYSEAQEYNKLDGIFFIGDNTQEGKAEEQTYFFNYIKSHTKEGTYVRAAMGNHEFKATGQNYADPQGATEKFLEYSGYESEDIHFELGGYHFIMVSPDLYNKSKAEYFSDEKLAWLEQELMSAAAATPDKPIFVMQHQPPRYTMAGSHGVAGDADLTQLLSNYPQVIDFSGHTHSSMADPRIIWQDSFTALNTASLCYLTFPRMEATGETTVIATNDEGSWVSGSMDSAVRNAGMYYIVEVDANDRVRVLIYNMFTKTVWGEPFLLDSLDPSRFVYTEDRAENAQKPEFSANSALQLLNNHHKNVMISIPQAQCKDVVQFYRVETYQNDKLVSTIYRLSGANYGDAAPERVKAYISGLESSKKYTVKVYATSCWGLDSEPLTLDFSTGSGTYSAEADVLDVTFMPDGSAINAATGMALQTVGAPKVTYDETLGQYVADFDGKDDLYSYTDISYWYDVIGKGYTLETKIWLDNIPTKSEMNPLSNLQSAGLGFLCNTDGDVYFYNMIGGSSYTLQSAKMTAGKWVHLIGTYDGSYVRFYIDGQLAVETAVSGSMKVPAPLAQMLCIGADSAVGTYANYFDGKIASAKLYSKALTQEEINELYNANDESEDASVCPTHGEVALWTPVTAADWAQGGAIVQGHYILTEDISLDKTLIVGEGTAVCINLNGFDITASGEATSATAAYRVFENSGELTITDSALADGVISGGTVWIHGETVDYAKGGNIYNAAGAVFTLYDGVIADGIASTGGNVEAASMGGNIYGEAGSVINIKGGTVMSGLATKNGSYCSENYRVIHGGNIGSFGQVNISGGTITGGEVSLSYTKNSSATRDMYLHGGNIAVLSGGELNISGGMISDGKIIGTRTNNTGAGCIYGRGGNIYISGADATISGGNIIGGTIALTVTGTKSGSTIPAYAKAFGGSIYIVDGTLDITGGRIAGGTIDSIAKASSASTSTAKAEVNAYGGNFYITADATVNMSGGTVTGGTAKTNDQAESTVAYGGNFHVTNNGVLNVTGGVISDGVSSTRGGNILVRDEGVAHLSGNAIISGGEAINGSNAVVQDLNAQLIVSGNAQLIQPKGNYCVYVRNGKLDMYGGTILGKLNLSASSSANKGRLAMYGGYVETLLKADSLPIANVMLYNGRVGCDPSEIATLGACACYVDNGDGTYTVWHEGAEDGTCSVCACDYTGKQVVMCSGSHTVAQDGTVCTVCGRTLSAALCLADGTQMLLTSTGDAVRLHLEKPGSYIKLNMPNVTVDIPENSVVYVDLNGKTAHFTGGGILRGMDSANDTYALSAGIATAAKTVTVSRNVDAPNGNRYIAVTDENGISFHRLGMKITAVSLRTATGGMYYWADWDCDSVLAENISNYGIACKLGSAPDAVALRDEIAEVTNNQILYSWMVNSAAGDAIFANADKNDEITGAIMNGIISDEEIPGYTNSQRGQMPIYAEPYVVLRSGEVVVAEGGINHSLYTVCQAVDEMITDMEACQTRTNYIAYMESLFADVWKKYDLGWNFTNFSKAA